MAFLFYIYSPSIISFKLAYGYTAYRIFYFYILGVCIDKMSV